MSLPSARPIAFNRRLRASWLREGLRLLADGTEGANWIERMEDLVKESNSGKDSITKSMRYLRHVWIEKGDADALRSDAINLYRSGPTEKSSIILSWGMAIATYPFLNDVASTIGRMLRVQPEVKLEQLLRKLSETYGERETVRRSGRYALGVITDFGFVERTKSAGCYQLGKPLKPDQASLSGWMVRAWFAATGGSAVIDRVVMAGSPGLAFFDSAALISDAIEVGVLVPERLSFSQDVLRLNSPQQPRQS
jgi:hypothetical protein